ncbi:fibronectin type III domain-containing protein [Saccharothrix xinjiangensis]|uniref:Fibronectin type-III domain-containing protein n=1 Tax=Saccharothrix xinjiangensis TaxID=204798 RepID=A0ABV9XZ62_9PSEU
MERRKLVALVGGVVLLGGTVALLRDESAPPPPPTFERFLADRVEHVPDTHELRAPTDLALTALDRTSLRASWTAAGGLGHGGFEVRWNGATRLVQGTETELTDLDVNADVAVEVRAVDGLGNRSEPATATAVPRLAHDEAQDDDLFGPVDVFDGPAALSPHRWRVLTAAKPYDTTGDSTDCLGLRPFNGRRLEVTCDLLELQSNVPMALGEPGPDGAVGRVVLTTDGPLTSDGEVSIALLPEPFQDLPSLAERPPPGAVVLRLTSTSARFEIGEGVPATDEVAPVAGTFTLPSSGVRHRWEVRVLPGAVVALRDGVALAGASVAVPWRVARPRLVFREARETLLDSFGVGGVPADPEPASVVRLGSGNGELLGSAPDSRLSGGTSVRVVATVFAPSDVPMTFEFGSHSAPATRMPEDSSGSDEDVVYADFPLTASDEPEPRRVRLRAGGYAHASDTRLVISDGPDARRPLPPVTDLPTPAPRVPAPSITVVREDGVARVVVELGDPAAREVAAVKGVEVDFDGERIATLPTNGSAGGRHEFALPLDDVPTGGHDVEVRVLPVAERGEVRKHRHSFQIRPL